MTNLVNCIIVDDESLAREVLEMHLSKIKRMNIVAVCENATEAFNHINSSHIDLVFLDVNMPGISGISFAKSISTDIKVIFTTAYREYAVDGFELRAVDYLLKPISFERLLKSVNTYFDVYAQRSNENVKVSEVTDFIFVRADRKMIKIDFGTIIYIESYSDYVKIYLEGQTITTRETISALEAKLLKQRFVRIHRSYIISMDHIISYTNEHVSIGNKMLPISRSYKKEVLETLRQYE